MKKADMTWPIRIWLSIVFAFLIVDNSFGLDGSTEGPFQQTASPNNYEVIDVANHHGDGEYNAKTMTGQTTRYYTTGEVDDSFWLKHLGEDYKNAIHMVVNSKNQYHGDYNMTGNEAQIIQEDNYSSFKGNPVEYNDKQYMEKETDNNSADNSYVENGSDTNATYVNDVFNTTGSPISLNSNETMQALEHSNRVENVEQPYNRVYAIRENIDKKLLHKFYNPNSYNMRKNNQKHEKTSQNTDTRNTYSQQTDTKYSQTDTNANTNTNQDEQKTNEEQRSLKSGNTPVVVDLPVPKKNVYHLDGNDNPVVLKMPPVIYHSKPTYMQQQQQDTNPQRYTSHMHQTMSGQTSMQYHTPPHSQTYQTQFRPQQYPYYQDYTYRQQVAPLPYRKQNVFNSFPSKTISNTNKSEVGQELRYIISKAPTGKQKAEEQTKDDEPCLTRVSRSNQELFEIGL